MFKKSTKILTLLLSVLLIMSSMSALTVSADGTAFDADGNLSLSNTTEYVTETTASSNTSGTDVWFTAVGQTVTYTISNVPESGMYMISADAWSDKGASTSFFKLTVSNGEETYYDTATYSNYSSLAKTLKMGSIYLEKDADNTFTLSLAESQKSSYIIKIRDLRIEKVQPIELSTTQENRLSINDWNLNRTYRATAYGDEDPAYTTWTASSDDTTWVGCNIMNDGKYATFRVNVPYTIEYDIYAMGGTQTTNSNSYTLYSDDVALASAVTAVKAGYTTLKATELGRFKLTAGTHDLKIVNNGAANYFAGLKLVPSVRHQLSSTETTTIAVRDGYYETLASSLNSGSSVSVTGFLNGDYGYVAFRNSASDKDTFYYSVNSEKQQKYTLSMVGGYKRSRGFKITNLVTGDEYTFTADLTTLSTGPYDTALCELGEITLPAGMSILKVEAVSGTTLFTYQWRLTPVIENIVSAGSAEILQSDGGKETVSIPVTFEGNIDNLAALTVEIAYDEALSFTGYTAGSVVSGMTEPDFDSRPVRLVWVDTTGVGIPVTSGTLATLEFSVPKATAKDYEFVVTVTVAAATDMVNFAETIKTKNGKVTVKSTAPIFTYTDGSDATAADVVAGTMKLSVDLNDNDKNLVIFAIYSENGDYAVLEYSKKATIADGIATATIEGIELDGTSNYYAKAFVWDDTTYSGFANTLGK